VAALMVFVMLDGSFFWISVGPMGRFLDVGWSDGSLFWMLYGPIDRFLDVVWSDGRFLDVVW